MVQFGWIFKTGLKETDRQTDRKRWKEREMKRQSNRLDETVLGRQARYLYVMSFCTCGINVVLVINIVELCSTL